MCGISGFAGFKSERVKHDLVTSLGMGIDSRGGHAAGFVTVDRIPIVGKKPGYWISARDRFIRRAILGHTTMMHSRYATHGAQVIQNAHPFCIRRAGEIVLWGCHNGIIYNAEESAKAHSRPFSVDSKELFELLADQEYDKINALTGYGVITWIEARRPDRVLVSRLSSQSDFFICETTCGGQVWGSTERIVKDALELSGLKMRHTYNLNEVGRVYQIGYDGVFTLPTTTVKVSPGAWSYLTSGGWGELDEADPRERRRINRKRWSEPDDTELVGFMAEYQRYLDEAKQ